MSRKFLLWINYITASRPWSISWIIGKSYRHLRSNDHYPHNFFSSKTYFLNVRHTSPKHQLLNVGVFFDAFKHFVNACELFNSAFSRIEQGMHQKLNLPPLHFGSYPKPTLCKYGGDNIHYLKKFIGTTINFNVKLYGYAECFYLIQAALPL